MGKKNLEQLFKDTFKDFHESPDEKVWDSIEATLDKKKNKRRVIPIWWKMGGVAAIFAILFFAINPLDNSEEIENTNPVNVVEQDNLDKKEILQESEDVIDNSSQITDSGEEESSAEKLDITPESKKWNGSDEKSVVNSNESIPQNSNPLQKTDTFNPKTSSETAVVENENVPSKEENLKNQLQQNIEKQGQDLNNAVAATDADSRKQETEVLSQTTGGEKTNEIGIEVAKTDVDEVLEEKNLEKKSIFDAIAEKNAEEEEELLLAENTESKWSVGPSVAPVYFTGAGDGSPIHSNFNSNSKSGNVNLSYGLTVAYNLGKRLKVRSGVHRVDFGYDTNEIAFSSSLESSTNELIDNIDYAATSRNLVVRSTKSAPTPSDVSSFSEVSTQTANLDGKMVQQLGYIEVPLELNYAIIDKKVGVDIIGGVSSLFLVDNTILLESEELVTEVGEANNVNSFNFSTNIGVGLNYEVSPKVQLNLEPVFKYQLNTFSTIAGPFRPISVGVYSGVSFKF